MRACVHTCTCVRMHVCVFVGFYRQFISFGKAPFPLDSVCIIPEEVNVQHHRYHCGCLEKGISPPPSFLGTEDGLERLDILSLLRVVDTVRVAQA